MQLKEVMHRLWPIRSTDQSAKSRSVLMPRQTIGKELGHGQQAERLYDLGC